MSSILVGRTRARSQAIQIIFQAEFQHKDVYDLLAEKSYVLDDGPIDDYAADLARGVAKSRTAIDALLSAVSQNWNLSRMPLVDRVIMAIAVHEMFDEEGVPVSVAISEAVEIAKVYGTDDSSSFINGILGRIARLHEAHPDVSMIRLVDYAGESVEETAEAAKRLEEEAQEKDASANDEAAEDELAADGETPADGDTNAEPAQAQDAGRARQDAEEREGGSQAAELTAEGDANGGQ